MRRVEFKVWQDPFLPAEELDEDEDDDEGDGPVGYMTSRRSKYSGTFISHPGLGFIPLGDHNLPSRRFNIWTGDTNFRVTRGDLLSVEAVAGVEMVRAVSPYRFDVGVAAMFSDEDVKGAVRFALCGPAPVAPGDLLAETLRRAFPCWAVVALTDGLRDCVVGDEHHHER